MTEIIDLFYDIVSFNKKLLSIHLDFAEHSHLLETCKFLFIGCFYFLQQFKSDVEEN